MTTHCFVDANHASDKVTRRSQSGILIFCNRAPIMWFSKRQNSVETSTFGSEFTALKQAVELVKALRYKLRMFGVPIEGPTDMFCNNEAVYKNSSTPELVLRKKHHSIAYHMCREAVAAGICRIAKEGGMQPRDQPPIQSICPDTSPYPKLSNQPEKSFYIIH